MKLTYAQKKEIYENGYVVVPGVVPQAMVKEALKVINHSVGREVSNHESSRETFSLNDHPAVTNLLHKTPLKDLLNSVIEMDKMQSIRSAQIALRYPSLEDPIPEAIPHFDGMHTKYSGVPEGTIWNFTSLVSVLLSDLTEDNAGNFTVWPGTHRSSEKYFQEHGAEALLKGMPPIEMPEPVQIKGKAGDVVINHYQIAHTGGPNISENIRYAIFFRCRHEEIDQDWQSPMKDIWKHWPGMKDIVEEYKR